MISGADVSSYQADFVPPAGDSFVFIKATESTTYRNPDAGGQASRARAKGLVVGWYHFLHPGNIDAQAAFFVANPDLQAGDLLVCDWEVAGTSNADKDAFLKAVKAKRPNHKVGLYCSKSWWTTDDKTNFVQDFLWIADYGVATPGIQHDYKFWQYTDTPYDQNHGYFDSLAALKAFATGTAAPAAPKPAPAVTAKPAPAPAPKPAVSKPVPGEPTATETKATPVTTRVTKGRTKGYKLPSTGAAVVKVVPKGYRIAVVETAKNKTVPWVQGKAGVWWRTSDTMLPPAPKAAKKTPKAATYTVKSGDTLAAIASGHGTTVAKLKKLNSIKNANVIYVGEVLHVS